MVKCKDCKNSCYLLNEYDEPYFWCNVFEDNFDEKREILCISYRPRTNADRIRSMTDEELAELMDDDLKYFNCNICELPNKADCDGSCCKEYILKWLKSEIK